MKRFLALAQGLAFVPCRAPLLFLIRKNFLSYLFSATAGRKVSVHYHQQRSICTLFFFFGINLFLKRITLSRCHSRILRLNLFVCSDQGCRCHSWRMINVEDDQRYLGIYTGVTYLWSVSATSSCLKIQDQYSDVFIPSCFLFLALAASVIFIWLRSHRTMYSIWNIYKSGFFQLVYCVFAHRNETCQLREEKFSDFQKKSRDHHAPHWLVTRFITLGVDGTLINNESPYLK